MGVTGLTTYAQQNGDKFFQSYCIHDTHLVVDAKCISFHLYRTECHKGDYYGGNYDQFAAKVTALFEAMLKCNITPIVVFDGNYIEPKLNRVYSRYTNSLTRISTFKPALGEDNVFPLCLRMLFTDIPRKMGLLTYRCENEADGNMVYLARALNCPILSFDSDFFIYDVMYVPFNKLALKPQFSDCWLLNCDLYKSENLLKAFPRLTRDHLPILATLVGNDYIPNDMFTTFFKPCRPRANKRDKYNKGCGKFNYAINWLEERSFQAALEEVIARTMHKTDPEIVANKVYRNIHSYFVSKDCDILKSLGLEERQNPKQKIPEYLTSKFQETDLEPEEQIPEWFAQKNSSCFYTSLIYEVALSNKFFFPPILEDCSTKPVYSICYPLVAAMRKIMSQTLYISERSLHVVSRNDFNSDTKEFDLEPYKPEIVSLSGLTKLSKSDKLDLLFNILNLMDRKTDVLSVPDDWQFFVLSMLYWVKNSTIDITKSYKYSLYVCAMILKIIDKKMGTFRSISELKEAHENVLEEDVTYTPRESDILKNISDDISISECAQIMHKLIPRFEYSDKQRYDIRIVSAFAEIQCCIYFIRALNSLLDEPLQKLIISDYINGTFLYNMCCNFNEHTKDILNYFQKTLEKSPTVLKACEALDKLISIVDSN